MLYAKMVIVEKIRYAMKRLSLLTDNDINPCNKNLATDKLHEAINWIEKKGDNILRKYEEWNKDNA